jgi:hypothetical protein
MTIGASRPTAGAFADQLLGAAILWHRLTIVESTFGCIGEPDDRLRRPRRPPPVADISSPTAMIDS